MDKKAMSALVLSLVIIGIFLLLMFAYYSFIAPTGNDIMTKFFGILR